MELPGSSVINHPRVVDDAVFHSVNTIFKRSVIQYPWVEREEACALYALAERRANAAQAVELYLSQLASQARVVALGLYVQKLNKKDNLISFPPLQHLLLNRHPPHDIPIAKRLDRTAHLGEYRKHARYVMYEALELPVRFFRQQ